MQFGNLIGLIIINIVLQAPGLWLSGRFVLGKEKVSFKDAVLITAVYTVVNTLIILYVGQEVAALVQLVSYLYIVRRYYETTWGKAAIVAVVMVLINVVIYFVLSLPGLFSYLF